MFTDFHEQVCEMMVSIGKVKSSLPIRAFLVVIKQVVMLVHCYHPVDFRSNLFHTGCAMCLWESELATIT